MSLNITVATPRYVICTSDRRLTDMNTGAIVSECSSQMAVLQCADALSLITYNGIGKYDSRTPADWLQELNANVKLMPLQLKEVLETIRREADDWVRRMSPTGDRRHTFVLGSWSHGQTSISLVSNYESAVSEKIEPKAKANFEVSTWVPSPGSDVSVLATGWTQSLSPGKHEVIGQVARRRGAAGIDIKNLCVNAIRDAAERRDKKGTISTSVLWAIAERDKTTECGLDVPDGTTVQEAPLLIQPAIMFKGVLVEWTPGPAPSWWGNPSALAEIPCPKCGAPVPYGYHKCGVCGEVATRD